MRLRLRRRHLLQQRPHGAAAAGGGFQRRSPGKVFAVDVRAGGEEKLNTGGGVKGGRGARDSLMVT